ncbi:hypothetical protein PR202_ga22928 [Eleusine coracana subsp. coracana]|uniref:Uncharacterized protein n=1 Tax=Eleusine coracana subsp. coracana TaxID=191504 RepID=A0AAV5D2Z2_ELECO|nr:hypothetical protein PR202_ga22928 [Eleusine coracana subsp. coracana]
MYCRGCAEAENTAEPQPQPAALIAAKEYCITLENSVDFLAGITALLFVGLEGLALEGQISRDRPTQDHLTKPMGASFFACVFGILFMVLETAPPLITDHEVVKLTKLFDVLMTCAISLVIFFITDALSKIPALLVFAPTFLILMVLAFHHTFTNNAPAPPPLPTVTNNPPTPASSPAVTNNDTNGESNKPASLELMKVIFTGFLAVSITSISKDSHNKGTHWFILLAAAAIVSVPASESLVGGVREGVIGGGISVVVVVDRGVGGLAVDPGAGDGLGVDPGTGGGLGVAAAPNFGVTYAKPQAALDLGVVKPDRGLVHDPGLSIVKPGPLGIVKPGPLGVSGASGGLGVVKPGPLGAPPKRRCSTLRKDS